MAGQDARSPAWKDGYREGYEAGFRAGYDAGVKEGLRDGLLQGIVDLCEVLGIELDSPRREHLNSLDADGLVGLREGLKQRRSWPA